MSPVSNKASFLKQRWQSVSYHCFLFVVISAVIAVSDLLSFFWKFTYSFQNKSLLEVMTSQQNSPFPVCFKMLVKESHFYVQFTAFLCCCKREETVKSDYEAHRTPHVSFHRRIPESITYRGHATVTTHIAPTLQFAESLGHVSFRYTNSAIPLLGTSTCSPLILCIEEIRARK